MKVNVKLGHVYIGHVGLLQIREHSEHAGLEATRHEKPFSVDPNNLRGCNAMSGGMCRVCNHSLSLHHPYHVQWVKVIDKQVTVDQNTKKKWDDAKNGRERTAALIQAGEKALKGYKDVIDGATNDLAVLADEYAQLSLSGSFSAQLEKATGLLEQKYKGMEEKEVGKEQLEMVKEGLDKMKKKLAIMTNIGVDIWTAIDSM